MVGEIVLVMFVLSDQLGFHPSLIYWLYSPALYRTQLFRYSTPPAYNTTVSIVPRARSCARFGGRASANRQCDCGRYRSRLCVQAMAWSTIYRAVVSTGL